MALPYALIHRSAWKGILRTSHKKNSRKFAVASDSSTQRQPHDKRPCCTPLGSKHSDLVAVVAPMCIKRLRLVTVQLPEKFSPIGPGTQRTSPRRSSTKFAYQALRRTHDPHRLSQRVLRIASHSVPFRGSAIVPTQSYPFFPEPRKGTYPYIRGLRGHPSRGVFPGSQLL